MRIAFVVHDYHQAGGHSRYVAELASRFSRSHEVHVFANTIQENGNRSINFHRVPAWRASALTTVMTFLLPATRRLKGDFDIIHAQGLCSLRSDVVTAHICNRAWADARKKNGDGGLWKDYLFDSLVSPLEKWLYQSSNGSWVIAISERINKDLAAHYGLQSRTSVIYHGVDVDKFNPVNRRLHRAAVLKELGLMEADTILLFVGDLRKGAETAIRALKQTPGAKLVFISRTDPDAYRRQARQLGLESRVVFCPATDSIERYYGAADIFVFPTPYDAFGMVISEAMATGLPVVTSREAGASELIEDQKDGILLDNPADPDDVAGRVGQLISDPTLRRTLGQAARAKIENYTWDRVAKQTMEVYERVLAERTR